MIFAIFSRALQGAALAGLLTAVAAGAPAVPSSIRIELGRRLFYDADLSINGVMACATCHEQKRGFTDGNSTHPGALDDPGKRHVPGLQNIGARRRLTWASMTSRLEQQALTPLFGEHPIEMAMKGHEAELLRRLAADPCYVRLFAAAFPRDKGDISLDTVTLALADFERSMASFQSPYDKAARGEASLSPEAAAGLKIFAGKGGCQSCHAGENFTDDDFHALEPENPKDRGLAEETGKPADAGLFRTPGLRNVALGESFFHDGKALGLPAAIARHKLTVALSTSEAAELIAFLETLTDRDFIADPRFSLPDQACPIPASDGAAGRPAAPGPAPKP